MPWLQLVLYDTVRNLVTGSSPGQAPVSTLAIRAPTCICLASSLAVCLLLYTYAGRQTGSEC